jgi:hypothetical protein
MMNTLTLELPGELYQKLKEHAERQNKKIEELAVEAVQRELHTAHAEPDWDADPLLKLPVVDTGIEDLAEEHDHYAYGTPKRKRHKGK